MQAWRMRTCPWSGEFEGGRRGSGGARVRGGGPMNPTMAAVGAGVRRGWIELRQTLTNAQDLWNYMFLPAVFLVVMYFLRGKTVPGTDFSLGTMSIPSVIGMQVAFGGLLISCDDAFHGERGWDPAPGKGDAERDGGLPRRQDRRRPLACRWFRWPLSWCPARSSSVECNWQSRCVVNPDLGAACWAWWRRCLWARFWARWSPTA